MPPPPAKSRYSNTLNVTLYEYDGDQKLFKDEVASLEDMLYIQRVSLDDIWAKLRQVQCVRHSQHKRPAPRTMEILENTTVFRDILLAVIRQKTVHKEISPVLKVADVIREYEEKGLMQDWWNLVFWNLLGAIAEQRQVVSREMPTGQIRDDHLEKSLLQDVLEVGQLYMNMYQGVPELHSGKALPTVSSTRISWLWRKVLRMAFVPTDIKQRDPGLSPPQSNPSARISVLALAMTYLFLQEQRKTFYMRRLSPPELRDFSRLATAMLRDNDLSEVKLQSYTTNLDLSVTMMRSLEIEWESLRTCFREHLSSSQLETGTKSSPSSSPSKGFAKKGSLDSEQIQSGLVRELQLAAQKRDINHASHVWGRFFEKFKELQNSRKNHDISLDKTSLGVVFAEFLNTFLSLGQLGKAIVVWNMMIESGYPPNKNHWINMLKVCVTNRDRSSLQSIWQTMLAQNLRPNNHMWTVYIRGLVMSRSWDLTLSALEEMGKSWLDSKNDEHPPDDTESGQTDLQEQHQPSMVPINTALAGLIGFERVKTAHSVLQWAKSRGLKPDTVTYNIFLRPAVRNNQRREVTRILKEMEANDCQPDVGTFTTLLDGLFRNPTNSFQSQRPEEQEKAVSRIFEDMRDNGIVANNRTYSTILDSLLSPKQFNLAAAGAVLAKMMELNIKPSRDIYTILVTHHFSCNPPNLIAIDRIWERIQREKTPVDHVFYDRMIENYSRIGQVEKALGFVRLMPKLGKTPGWLALHAVLDALVHVEEWGIIKDLLKDVVDPKQFFKHGTRGWRGEDDFWDLVNVLRARGLELPTRPPPPATQ